MKKIKISLFFLVLLLFASCLNWINNIEIEDVNLDYTIDTQQIEYSNKLSCNYHNYDNSVKASKIWMRKKYEYNVYNWDKYEIIKEDDSQRIEKNWETVAEVIGSRKRILEFRVSGTWELSYVSDMNSVYEPYRVVKDGVEIFSSDHILGSLRYSIDEKDLYFDEWIQDIVIYKNWIKVTDKLYKTKDYKIDFWSDDVNVISRHKWKSWKHTMVYDKTWMPWLSCDANCMKDNQEYYIINGVQSKIYNQVLDIWFSKNGKYFALVKDFDWKYILIDNWIEKNKYDYIYYRTWFNNIWYNNEELIYLATDNKLFTVVNHGWKEIWDKFILNKIMDVYIDNQGNLFYLALLNEEVFGIIKNGKTIFTINKNEITSPINKYNSWRMYLYDNLEKLNFTINNTVFLCQQDWAWTLSKLEKLSEEEIFDNVNN